MRKSYNPCNAPFKVFNNVHIKRGADVKHSNLVTLNDLMYQKYTHTITRDSNVIVNILPLFDNILLSIKFLHSM